jgi:hypothetical protein
VRAFKQGMAPVVIALLLSTAWILAPPPVGAASSAGELAAVAAGAGSGLVIWRTRCTCCGCWAPAPCWGRSASFLKPLAARVRTVAYLRF